MTPDSYSSKFKLHFGYFETGILITCFIAYIAVSALCSSNLIKMQGERLAGEGRRVIQSYQAIAQTEQSLPTTLTGFPQKITGLEKDPSFAYLMVLGNDGNIEAKISQPAVVIPTLPSFEEPSAWLYDRTVNGPGGNPLFFEFGGPIFKDGKKSGLVILGLHKPVFSMQSFQKQASSLALSFMLLALFLLVFAQINRHSLDRLSKKLHQLSHKENLHDAKIIKGTGVSSQFIGALNHFVGSCQNQIQTLEDELDNDIITDKIHAYKLAKLESFMEKLPDGIMVIDSANTITFVNIAVETLLGIDHDVMYKQKFQEWTEPPLTDFLHRFQTRKNGRLQRADAIEYQPENAPQKTLRVSGYPLINQDKDAASTGTLFIIKDCTSEALAKQARGDFVAHVAHELKSPLNTLSMYSEMLLGEGGTSKDFLIESVNVIHDEVDRLNLLITSLLSISQIEMGSLVLNRKRVKFKDLLKDAFDTVTRDNKDAEMLFEINLPTEFSHLFIDKDLMRIAINNLLTNAIKYNRQGGTVTLNAVEDDETIAVHVQDTGIGITEEDQQRIFEKFFRVDSEETKERKGHGLGLTLANDIIHLHHGQLLVQSTLGKGSTFTIHFDKKSGLVQDGI